jgi:Small-conductance mechanosensitive channel
MFRNSLIALVVYIVILVIALALIKFVFSLISTISLSALSYEVYVNILVTLFFGVLIVFKFADVVYWNLRFKLPHPEAASVRSVFRIIGLVALLVAVVGSNVSPTAAAPLGGFAGLVVGFATQQVLAQAIAGVFISIARPFRATDKIAVAGQEGVVEDITSLYTILETEKSHVLIPNSMLISNVITRYKS